MQPSDFKEGEIYKMDATPHSHVTKPYYVEIITVAKDFIQTNIPGHHSLYISKLPEINNWNYHIPRMTFVAKKETHGHLLLNQLLN